MNDSDLSSLDSYEYDHAYSDFLQRACRGFITEDPLVGRARSRKTRHAGSGRNVIHDEPVDTVGRTASGEMWFDRNEVRKGNVESHSIQVAKLGQAFLESMTAMMLEHVNQITEATGNVKNLNGEDITVDSLIDMLEMIDMKFNEFDEVINDGLAFYFSREIIEKISKLEEKPEHRERIARMYEKKLAIWKSTRKSRLLKTVRAYESLLVSQGSTITDNE